MKNKTFKKIISLSLSFLMVLSTLVTIVPEIALEAKALAEVTDTTYRKADKYGTQPWTGSGDRWVYFKDGNKSSNNIKIYYPSAIYLDISETLQSAGYNFDVEYNFGTTLGYRLLLAAPIWCDYTKGSDILKETPPDDKYYTMTNVFENYTVDASLPDGATRGRYGSDSGATRKNYDVRVANGGSGGSDAFDANGARHTAYVGLSATSSGMPNNATLYLMGTPKREYVGHTEEHWTTGTSARSYGTGLNPSDGIDKGAGRIFDHKYDDSSYKDGQWTEMRFTVTIYDKSALNTEIATGDRIVNENGYLDQDKDGIADYLEYGNQTVINKYLTELDEAKAAIKVRETTQDNLETAKNELYNASYAVTFAANNSNLLSAMNAARNLIATSDYSAKYTDGARATLETTLANAEANSLSTTVPTYRAYTTSNAVKEAADDQDVINALTSAINNALNNMGIQSYDITWKDDNGTIIDITKVAYGSLPTHADATKAANAQYTYTFTGWNPVVTDVTGPATYTATFSSVVNKYTVTWKNGDTVLETDTDVAYGSTPEYNGATPTKASDDDYDYTFKGWSPEITDVTGDVTYVAEFNATANTKYYTVTFKDWNGTVLFTQTVEEGTAATAPGNPSRNYDDNNHYAFASWDKSFDNITADTEVTAIYTTTSHSYNYVQNADGASHTGTCSCGKTVTGVCSGGSSTCETKAVCATCGREYGNLKAHEMGSWITDKDPTCITDGSKHRVCANCDYTETETISATGNHVYGEWTVDGNYHTRTCTADPLCTASESGAHSFTEDCKQKGTTDSHDYKCSVCSARGANVNGEPTLDGAEECYKTSTIEKINGNNDEHKETCVCGNTREVAHTLVDIEGTYVAPTCIAKGSQGKECTVCEHTFTKEIGIDADAHAYGEWIEKVPATCIGKGTEGHYNCSLCNKNFDENKVEIDDLTIEVNADAHTNLTVTDAKSATCTTAGNIKYWTCDGCGKIYSDANAKTEITADQTVIGVIAHKWISTAVESELAGFKLKTPADCVHKAVHYKNCSACGQSAETIDATQTFTFGDALGHKYGAWANDGVKDDHTGTHTKTCTVCSETDGFDDYKVTEDHSWDAGVVTEYPSYTAAGVKTYTCTECQTTYEEAIPANEDKTAPTVSIKWEGTTWDELLNTITFGTYVNYNIELEIDGADAGIGVSKTEYLVSNKVISDITTATGWTEYDETDKLTISKANEANYVVYAKVTDKAGNVAYASTDGFVIDTTEPVVTVTGAGANGIYCSDVTVKVEEEHLLMFRLNNAAYPIGEDGEITLSNGSYSIVVTDEAGNETAVVFTVLGEHDYEALEGEANTEENFAEAATCTEAAKYYKVCSRCGDVNKDDSDTYSVGDALGHKDGTAVTENEVAATCTTDGSYDTVTYCTVCGEETSCNTTVVPALGHTMQHTARKEADCLTDGNIEYWTCTTEDGCGKTYADEDGKTEVTDTVIPATDHNWDKGAYLTEEDKPTCTKTGTFTYTCQNANCPTKTYTEVVEALGHKYGEWIAEIPASCIATGTKGHYHCAVCGVNFDADKNVLAELTIGVNAAAHTELNKTDAKSATCTTAGNIEYWTCEGCKKIYREEAATNEIEFADTVISATGHTYDRKVADAAHMKSEATCESGTVYYYECSVCGEADRNDAYTWEDNDMRPHDFTGAWSYSVTAKQHQRQCSKCDAWTELEDCTFAESYNPVTNEGDIHTHEALCECGNVKTEVCTAVQGETHEDPTCGDSSDYGWTDYSCALCSNEWEGDIVYVRHNLELKEKVDGDCVTKGYIIYECVNNGCPHEVRQELGFGTTHVGDAEAGTRVTIRDAKKATCNTEGYTGDTYCECGVKLVTGETIPVDGNAHQWGTPAIQPSTCVVAGFSIVYCDDCGEEKRTALELDPDAHMSVVTGVDTQPTCTEAGYTGATICEDCKTVINPGKPIPALGHKLSPWMVITMPSEDGKTPGYAERYCLRCGGEREPRNDFYYNELHYVVYHNDNGVRLTVPRYYIEGDYTLRPEKNPTKAQDDKYTYEFIGWDHTESELNSVHKQMAVIAQYKAIEKSYKVTFRDASGKVIPVEGIAGKDILFSEITKAYNGATPTKAATSDYRYEFMGWNISCDYETGEATVTPEFRQIPIEKEDEDSDGIFGWLIRWIKSILAKIGIVF